MMNRRLLCTLAAILTAAAFTGSARAEWKNGWWVYPYRYHFNRQLDYRPTSARDKTLAAHDAVISNAPINAKGFNISTTRLPDGSNWAYRWIAIWHCEISNLWRSGPGIHHDFIQIRGGGDRQDVPTTVLIQDVYIHDGDAIPIMIEDAVFDTITLRDVRYENTTTGVQIGFINSGSVKQVVIDHCPNMGVALMGRPGTIGTVYVKNSPGIRISDVMTKNGRSGCKIVYLN